MHNPAARGPLIGLGLAGILAAVALAGFGFLSLRHDRIVTLHEARQAAHEQVQRLQDAIQRVVLHPALPSEADVMAYAASPGDATQEPLARVSRSTPGTLAILVGPRTTYPGLSPGQPLPAPLDISSLTEVERAAWAAAETFEIDSKDRDKAPRAWAALLLALNGTEAEDATRFRFARSLLLLGRTAEALPLLEAVASASPPHAGETGLPLDVLAFRGLLQAAEVDRRAATHLDSWIDGLCTGVLLRWRLPSSLADEWISTRPDRIRRWKQIAQMHEESRTFFRRLLEDNSLSSTNRLPPRWLSGPGGGAFLLTAHDASGTTWLLARPEAELAPLIQQTVLAQGLPAYLAAHIAVAGRDLLTAPAGAEVLASADPGTLQVDLQLTTPEALLAHQRVRTRVFAGLIAFAAVTVVFGLLVALRGYERQRQYAAMQSDFVASVSHELRAPLAAVRLMVEELCDLPPEDVSRRSEYHRLVLQETHRLGLLIENVLRFARLERSRQPLVRESVDVAEVARSSAEGLRSSAVERDVHLDLALPANETMVQGDSQALRQVVINLLDNAIKHSPAGATVTVGVERARKDGSKGSVSLGTSVRLWVEDQGTGIPVADQQRIFDSFCRLGNELRRETSGVGLGLAIVQRLVRAHGGTVSVRSAPNAGSRFTVEIPVTDHSTPQGRLA